MLPKHWNVKYKIDFYTSILNFTVMQLFMVIETYDSDAVYIVAAEHSLVLKV